MQCSCDVHGRAAFMLAVQRSCGGVAFVQRSRSISRAAHAAFLAPLTQHFSRRSCSIPAAFVPRSCKIHAALSAVFVQHLCGDCAALVRQSRGVHATWMAAFFFCSAAQRSCSARATFMFVQSSCLWRSVHARGAAVMLVVQRSCRAAFVQRSRGISREGRSAPKRPRGGIHERFR